MLDVSNTKRKNYKKTLVFILPYFPLVVAVTVRFSSPRTFNERLDETLISGSSRAQRGKASISIASTLTLLAGSTGSAAAHRRRTNLIRGL